MKYTKSGLWIEETEVSYRIGLSVKGQDDVGEVMYVELPDFNEKIKAGDNLIGVEGAKAVTEITAPFNGTVINVHKALEDDTALLNSIDQADNWIIELTEVTGIDEIELFDDAWAGMEPPAEDEE